MHSLWMQKDKDARPFRTIHRAGAIIFRGGGGRHRRLRIAIMLRQ